MLSVCCRMPCLQRGSVILAWLPRVTDDAQGAGAAPGPPSSDSHRREPPTHDAQGAGAAPGPPSLDAPPSKSEAEPPTHNALGAGAAPGHPSSDAPPSKSEPADARRPLQPMKRRRQPQKRTPVQTSASLADVQATTFHYAPNVYYVPHYGFCYYAIKRSHNLVANRDGVVPYLTGGTSHHVTLDWGCR
jgi:hypothetical protein